MPRRSSAIRSVSLEGTGELAVGTSEVQGPDIKCVMVMLKADPSNSGVVYYSPDTGVTVPDGSDDVTTGFPLSANEDSGWLSIGNLDELYFIASASGQRLIYQYSRT